MEQQLKIEFSEDGKSGVAQDTANLTNLDGCAALLLAAENGIFEFEPRIRVT